MPKNWNRRFKHNRDKIKTGDIYELAEVVRNLSLRESEKGLSTGEKQMFTRTKKILASELMYALDKVPIDIKFVGVWDTSANSACRCLASRASAVRPSRFHSTELCRPSSPDFMRSQLTKTGARSRRHCGRCDFQHTRP